MATETRQQANNKPRRLSYDSLRGSVGMTGLVFANREIIYA